MSTKFQKVYDDGDKVIYAFGNYRLHISYQYPIDEHIRLGYKFFKEGELLFEGDDFYASCLNEWYSKLTAFSLLRFLTCKPGDVESDYFDTYTDRQIEWAKSFECEQLACEILSLEEWHQKRNNK